MLSHKTKYLQIALNSTPSEGEEIIRTLPSSDRILIEAGTPLIKTYGVNGIRRLRDAWNLKTSGSFDCYIVADIVIVWKEFYSPVANTGKLAEEFLKEIK